MGSGAAHTRPGVPEWGSQDPCPGGPRDRAALPCRAQDSSFYGCPGMSQRNQDGPEWLPANPSEQGAGSQPLSRPRGACPPPICLFSHLSRCSAPPDSTSGPVTPGSRPPRAPGSSPEAPASLSLSACCQGWGPGSRAGGLGGAEHRPQTCVGVPVTAAPSPRVQHPEDGHRAVGQGSPREGAGRGSPSHTLQGDRARREAPLQTTLNLHPGRVERFSSRRSRCGDSQTRRNLAAARLRNNGNKRKAGTPTRRSSEPRVSGWRGRGFIEAIFSQTL